MSVPPENENGGHRPPFPVLGGGGKNQNVSFSVI